MAFIDARGRLFGRINVFDAAVLGGIVAAVALSFVGYGLLKVPLPPQVTEVTPKTFVEGPSLRMAIKGENLVPYMHVYLRRTGEPTAVMHDSTQWIKTDSYTLANTARTAFRLESPKLGEVETLDTLLPGTYDMIFHDDLKVVGIVQSAFTVRPAPKLKVQSKEREATLRVSGAFIGMNGADAANVRAGSKIPPDAEEPPGEIVGTGTPMPDVAKVDTGAGTIEAPIVNRWRVPADLRLRCVMASPGKCFFLEELVVVGNSLKLRVDGASRIFLIDKISSDSAQAR